MRKFKAIISVIVAAHIFLTVSFYAKAETLLISKISASDIISPVRKKAKGKFRINLAIPGGGSLNFKFSPHKLKSVTPQYTLPDGRVVKDKSPIKLFRGEAIQRGKRIKAAAASYNRKGKDRLFISFISESRSKRQQFNHFIITIKNGQNQAKFYAVKRLKINDEGIEIRPLKEAGFNFNSFLKSSPSVRTTQIMPEVEISADADSHWYSAFGESSATTLTDYINTTETIYQTQLGVTFNVTRLNVFTSTGFGSDNAYDKLCHFQLYTTGYNTLKNDINCTAADTGEAQIYFGTADVYYLFTGQDLSGGIIGLAYYSAICRSEEQAAGLVQYYDLSPQLTPITFAHELGHNLSAIHDGDNSSNGISVVNCTNAPANRIMAASLSLPDSFSDCSLNTIDSYLTNYNTCLDMVEVELPSPTPSPTPSPSPSASPSPSPSLEPISAELTATLSKKGSFKANLDIENNIGSCESRLYISHKKTLFTDEYAAHITQSSDLNLTSKLRLNILPDKNGKLFPIYVQYEVKCGSQIDYSDIIKIRPGKIKSNKRISRKKWAKKLLGKIRNSYGFT